MEHLTCKQFEAKTVWRASAWTTQCVINVRAWNQKGCVKHSEQYLILVLKVQASFIWTSQKRSLLLDFENNRNPRDYCLLFSQLPFADFLIKVLSCRSEKVRTFGDSFPSLIAIILNQPNLQVCPSLQIILHHIILSGPESDVLLLSPRPPSLHERFLHADTSLADNYTSVQQCLKALKSVHAEHSLDNEWQQTILEYP